MSFRVCKKKSGEPSSPDDAAKLEGFEELIDQLGNIVGVREKVVWVVSKEVGRDPLWVYEELTYRQTIGFLSASNWYRGMMTPKQDDLAVLKAKAASDFNHYNGQGML